ncbi:NAD(P)H-binding protein [Pseudonocardia sp. TRM90224]|uniref:NAD(P)H-binding protein n=1 Tax=Pseudonocardia sp. TRM90224 TaxID=2812678 RepID=UPI001E542CAF|nr:NAD(P)H-binding protein [Pseudonocardia sp. TRM90224]
MTTNTAPTLVVGGTGTSGRRVAAQLTGRGVPVRIATRSSRPRFDWQDTSSWGPALNGVAAAFLSYHPDIGDPDAAEHIRSFAEEALARGTRRLVLLSGRGSQNALEAERALRESGAEWTIVRASWFAQNFDDGFLTDLLRHDELAFPAGQVAEPFIDADDVAAVAVAALTDERHIGQVYEVTGPRLLTFGDAAAELSAAVGRPLRYRPITFDQFADALVGDGVPTDAVAGTVAVFQEILDGRNAHVTDGVQRALGRPATDFADYARAVAKAA